MSKNLNFYFRWLLNHDPSKRPSSQDILQSEFVPPLVLEDKELRDLVRHTLSNPKKKCYKYLIESCFKQTISPAQDIMYSEDLMPLEHNISNMYNYALRKVIKVFQIHGGENVSTPLLMPKASYYEGSDSVVYLMTHSGSVVCLPHDLRVPFARFIACNGVTNMRRYSVDRVFREKKIFGTQPRELVECAFDIVTPSSDGLMPDAEVVYIFYDIVNKIPALRNKDFTIYLHHTLLLKAILLHSGIKDSHNKVLDVLADGKVC